MKGSINNDVTRTMALVLLGWVLASGAWLWGQDAPATGPATGPATAPADAGPEKPSRDKAWVSGRVLGADGEPAVGLQVRAEKNEPKGMGGPGSGVTGGPREYRVLTDAEGNFLIKEMDVTQYILVAGNNDIGWLYREIPVAPGKETKLGTLRLKKLS